MAGMGAFDWADPFLLDEQLTEDERMVFVRLTETGRQWRDKARELSKVTYKAAGLNKDEFRILLPPEARDAQRRGRRAMDAGDLALAESSFDEAYRLGLTDEETRVWRGWARVGAWR